MKITSVVIALLIIAIIFLIGHQYNFNRIKVGTVAIITVLVLIFMFKVQEEFSADIAQTVSSNVPPIFQQATGLTVDNNLLKQAQIAVPQQIQDKTQVQMQTPTPINQSQQTITPTVQPSLQSQVQSTSIYPQTSPLDKLRNRQEIDILKRTLGANISNIQQIATTIANALQNMNPTAISNSIVDNGLNAYTNANKAIVENTDFDKITSSNIVAKDRICMGDKCIDSSQFSKLMKILE